MLCQIGPPYDALDEDAIAHLPGEEKEALTLRYEAFLRAQAAQRKLEEQRRAEERAAALAASRRDAARG